MQNHDEQKRGDSRSGKAKSRRGSGSRPNVGSFYRQRWITQQIKAKLLEEGHPEECRICGAKADRGLIFDRADLKLGTYFDGWLKDVRNTVRQRTWERYESIVRVHIKPALGAAKLQALTPNHLRALYRDKLDAGLAPRTVNYIHVTLHKALKDTVSDGLDRITWRRSSLRGRRNRKYTHLAACRHAGCWTLPASKATGSRPYTSWLCIAA
jgi:hypothetical protein